MADTNGRAIPEGRPTRCALCKREATVKLREYVEPKSGEDSTAVWIMAAMCDDCEVVHWAIQPMARELWTVYDA